jgi:hypothetical protein
MSESKPADSEARKEKMHGAILLHVGNQSPGCARDRLATAVGAQLAERKDGNGWAHLLRV